MKAPRFYHLFYFADDDTNLFHSDKNLVSNLFNTINNELKEITPWLSVNKLSVNINKT